MKREPRMREESVKLYQKIGYVSTYDILSGSHRTTRACKTDVNKRQKRLTIEVATYMMNISIYIKITAHSKNRGAWRNDLLSLFIDDSEQNS